MFTYTKPKTFVTIGVVSLLAVLFVLGFFFWRNQNVQNNFSDNANNLSVQRWQLVQESQFSLSVSPDWQIERESCSEELRCSNVLLRKNGFYINISTNVLFTGGGSLGNPFSDVCGGEYSQPIEITNKLVRLDAVAPSDCVLSTLSQTASEQSSKQSVKMWVGSTITNKIQGKLSPYLTRSDNFKAISPTYFNQAKFVTDENGQYIAITYGYDGNMPNSSAGLAPKILTLESSELQQYLQEMDKIVATFQINPNFNFTN